MHPVWFGKISEGPFFELDEFDQFIMFLGRFAVGDEIEVVLRKRTKLSSNNQNRYYYGVICKIISEYTGHSVDEIDSILKWKFLKERDERGMEYVPSKMELSTVDREKYHEQCRRWAAIVLGLNIPLPERVDTGES